MSRFLSNKFNNIVPYTPGEQPKIQGLVKLNTNESPFPPSPKVLEALNKEELSRLNLYSDPNATDVRNAISEVLSVDPDMIMMGNGSDEILSFTFEAFCDSEHEPVFADLTYGFYPVFCEIYHLKPTILKLNDDLSINVNDYIGLNRPVFIANPNAPTGIALDLDDVEKIVSSNDSIVLIDEAYVDFGAESAVKLTKKYKNLIVSRTFSKSRNLAGARLGFAVADKELINDLNTMRYCFNPYNINRLSIIAGKESVLDVDYFEKCVDEIIKTREYTVKELEKRGFIIPDSKSNFIFPEHKKMDGTYYFNELRKRNILVRHFDSERTKNHVRITIGSKKQMDNLIDATDEILKSI